MLRVERAILFQAVSTCPVFKELITSSHNTERKGHFIMVYQVPEKEKVHVKHDWLQLSLSQFENYEPHFLVYNR